MLRCVFPVSVVVLASWACAQSSESLTLDEAFRSVEKVNVNVLLSREAVAQAIESAQQQRADLWPAVSASVAQRRTQSASISPTVRTQGGNVNRFDGKLVGSFNLLNPQQIAQYRVAQLGIRVAELDLEQTLQTIYSTVAQTYFAHLRNVKRIAVLDANIGRARELVLLARNRADAGVATQIDVTRAESQLAIAEQARIQQDTTVYQSELQLKRLLDLNPSGSLRLEDFVVRPIEEAPYSGLGEATAFEKRVDYLRSRQALQVSQAQVRTAEAERFGAVALSGEFGYANRRIFEEDDQRAWTAGLTYSVPVFDAWRIRANERIAQSQLRSQNFRLRQLELQIASELRLSAQDARSRFIQVGVAEKSLRLSEEELQLAQRRFEQGVADNREIIDAQNRLATASDNLNEAIFQYNLSRVELARSRGEVRTVLQEKQP